MHRQSFPTLTLSLALAAVLVTPCMLHAQAFAGASSEPTDTPAAASGSSLNPAPSSPIEGTSNGSVSHIKYTTPTRIEMSSEALNGILQRYRQAGDRKSEAHTLGTIASSYSALGQQQKAAEFYQSEVAIWRELGDKQNEATTLAHLGDVYREWGFPQQAIRLYHDSLKAYPAGSGKVEEAAVLNNLGLAHFALHEKKQCLEYLNQSLAAYRAAQDREGEARTLTNLGSTYAFLLNDPHKALDYFQKALTELELFNDHATEASAYELMGGVWLKLQKKDMAVQSYQRAIFLYDRLGDAKRVASARRQLDAVDGPPVVASNR